MTDKIVYDCCANPCELVTKECVVCTNCYALLDSVNFEDTMYLNGTKNSNIRFNKFLKIISDYELPWYVRQEMIDLFPRIESYFFESERINFINMHQLAFEMCRVLGYSECGVQFNSLKTKSRVKQIRQFVEAAITTIPRHSGELIKLQDIPLIKLSLDFEPDMSKVVQENHIYSNIDAEKNNKASENKTKTKAKAKIVLRILPKGREV